MPDIDPEIKALQDSIFLNKVARARKMTPEERFMDGLMLSAQPMRLISIDCDPSSADFEAKLRTEYARRLRIRRLLADHNLFAPAGTIDDE